MPAEILGLGPTGCSLKKKLSHLEFQMQDPAGSFWVHCVAAALLVGHDDWPVVPSQGRWRN